jgi:hypothetical protein
MTSLRTFSLDDPRVCAFVERHLAQIKSLQDALNGALSLYVDQNGLEGAWELDWPNRQLVRRDPVRMNEAAA